MHVASGRTHDRAWLMPLILQVSELPRRSIHSSRISGAFGVTDVERCHGVSPKDVLHLVL